MFQRYKEIFFGLAFGIAAVFLDTAMDALTGGNSLVDEVIEHPGMLLYRAVFIVLGLALGSLLWQRNRRERQFRNVAETLHKFQQQCEAEGLMLRSILQMLLTRDDLHLSDSARQLVRQAYERTQAFQRLAEQKLLDVED